MRKTLSDSHDALLRIRKSLFHGRDATLRIRKNIFHGHGTYLRTRKSFPKYVATFCAFTTVLRCEDAHR